MPEIKLAAAGERLRRIEFEMKGGYLGEQDALKKLDKVATKFGLKADAKGSPEDRLQSLLRQAQYDAPQKAGPVDLKGDLANGKPRRSAKIAVEAVEDWDKASGIGKDQRKKKEDHVAGKASQFTDAYPFVMMALDLAPGDGAYWEMSQLSPGKPSPDAVLVGDNHLTNSGSVPGGDKQAGMVYGIVDATKAGVGRIEADLERLATTSVITGMEKGKLSRDDALKLANGAGDAYFQELTRFATSGKKPPAFLPGASLDPHGLLADLLKKAGEKSPDAEVKKYSKDGKTFSKGFAIDDKAERKAVDKAFGEYVNRLPKAARDGFKVLDLGTKVDVGGSNSGMPHYLVLAEVNGKKQVFEMKQLVPSPVEHKSGDPAKADGELSARFGAALAPGPDPLAGYAQIGDIAFTVQPYDSRAKTLDFDKPSLSQLLQVARDTATLTARVHAQTVDIGELRGWLKGLDPKAATGRLVKFAESYSKQAEIDADGLK